MRIVPEVIDGKVRIFAVKQLSSLQSEIVLIEVDLEAASASPAGKTPASTAAVEIVVALIATPVIQQQNNFIVV